MEFSNERATAVIDDDVLELFRNGGAGESSQRWLIRYLVVDVEVGKKGHAVVGWRRPPGGEEGTLTFEPDSAAEAEKLAAALVKAGATRKE